MAKDNLREVCRMVRQAVEDGRPYLDDERCAALLDAAGRGNLGEIHDLLVEGMVELKGLAFTRRLLQSIDRQVWACQISPGCLH